MTTPHTPGPWIAKELHANYEGFVIVHETGSGLRRVDAQKDGTFTKDQAYLIAAAPEFLKAAISLELEATHYLNTGKGNKFLEKAVLEMRLAIAKAEGR